jgi:hypothetical protein
VITAGTACACVLLLAAGIDPAVTALSALGLVITVPVLIVRGGRRVRRGGFPWRGIAGTGAGVGGTACLALLCTDETFGSALVTSAGLALAMGALAVLAVLDKIRANASENGDTL